MLDPRFFRIRAFSVSALTITAGFFAMFGMFFILSQYFQFVLGYSPLLAGIAQLPSAIVMVVLSPRSPAAVARIGVRKTVFVGMVSMVAGLLVFAQVGPSTPYMVAMVALVLTATGMGADDAVDHRRAGRARCPPARPWSRVGGQRHHPRGGWGAGHCRDGLGADVGVPGVAEPARPAARRSCRRRPSLDRGGARGGRTCPRCAWRSGWRRAPAPVCPGGIDRAYVAAAVMGLVAVFIWFATDDTAAAAGFHDRARQVRCPRARRRTSRAHR